MVVRNSDLGVGKSLETQASEVCMLMLLKSKELGCGRRFEGLWVRNTKGRRIPAGVKGWPVSAEKGS